MWSARNWFQIRGSSVAMAQYHIMSKLPLIFSRKHQSICNIMSFLVYLIHLHRVFTSNSSRGGNQNWFERSRSSATQDIGITNSLTIVQYSIMRKFSCKHESMCNSMSFVFHLATPSLHQPQFQRGDIFYISLAWFNKWEDFVKAKEQGKWQKHTVISVVFCSVVVFAVQIRNSSTAVAFTSCRAN